ncbi:UAA transporter [Calocera cornea HHB12733]|uniref:UAA transporter n=1 Tax=Calocera cornea HHB12733 TaxID=1353952 RepID=A0A165FKA7_9BASI|nr:UAA transporter [Calocera cornea HHB12733]
MGTAVDWTVIVTLVFGGCCSNAWSLGRLLQRSPLVGPALTVAQILVVAVPQLPHFITLHPVPRTTLRLLPALRPRVVPLRRWLIDVLLITAVSLLNNTVFRYRIPLTLHIIFRSGGLAVSMLLGYLRLGRKYSVLQVSSVLLVTLGIVLATLSSRQSTGTVTTSAVAPADYAAGICLLLVGLLLSGWLGMRQEETFRVWGPQWQESLFYTHLLSLPIWSLFLPDIHAGLAAIQESSDLTPLYLYLPPRGGGPLELPGLQGTWTRMLLYRVPTLYWALALNVLSQYACVAGVNRLTTRVSSVAVNLILTARKTISVVINVLYLGEGWNAGLVAGAGMVAGGTILYGLSPAGKGGAPVKTKAEEKKGKAD